MARRLRIHFKLLYDEVCHDVNWPWIDYMPLAYVLNNPTETKQFNEGPVKLHFISKGSFSLSFTASERSKFHEAETAVRDELAFNRSLELKQFCADSYPTLLEEIKSSQIAQNKMVYAEQHGNTICIAYDRAASQDVGAIVGALCISGSEDVSIKDGNTSVRSSTHVPSAVGDGVVYGDTSARTHGRDASQDSETPPAHRSNTPRPSESQSGHRPNISQTSSYGEQQKQKWEHMIDSNVQRVVVTPLRNQQDASYKNYRSTHQDREELPSGRTDPVPDWLGEQYAMNEPLAHPWHIQQQPFGQMPTPYDLGTPYPTGPPGPPQGLPISRTNPSARSYSTEYVPPMPEERDIQKTEITIYVKAGLLETEKAGALVCTMPSDLNLRKAGTSASLLKAAGNRLQDELDTKYKQSRQLGHRIAVVNGHRLNCQYVLFGVMNKYDQRNDQHNKGPATYFANTVHAFMERCLIKADELGVASLAFPVVGCGNLQFPIDIVTKEMFQTVADHSENYPATGITHVSFVIYHQDEEALRIFKDTERKFRGKACKTGSPQLGQDICRNRDSMTYDESCSHQYPYCRPATGLPARDRIFTCVFSQNHKLTVYKGDIMSLDNIDMIACAENPAGNADGYICKRLYVKGKSSYQNAKSKAFKCELVRGDVAVCSAGANMFKAVAHVIRYMTQCVKDETDRKKKVDGVLNKLLEAMVTLKYQSLAMPFVGLVKGHGDHIFYTKRLFKSIHKFSEAHSTTPLHVHLVNIEPGRTNNAIKTIQQKVRSSSSKPPAQRYRDNSSRPQSTAPVVDKDLIMPRACPKDHEAQRSPIVMGSGQRVPSSYTRNVVSTKDCNKQSSNASVVESLHAFSHAQGEEHSSNTRSSFSSRDHAIPETFPEYGVQYDRPSNVVSQMQGIASRKTRNSDIDCYTPVSDDIGIQSVLSLHPLGHGQETHSMPIAPNSFCVIEPDSDVDGIQNIEPSSDMFQRQIVPSNTTGTRNKVSALSAIGSDTQVSTNDTFPLVLPFNATDHRYESSSFSRDYDKQQSQDGCIPCVRLSRNVDQRQGAPESSARSSFTFRSYGASLLEDNHDDDIRTTDCSELHNKYKVADGTCIDNQVVPAGARTVNPLKPRKGNLNIIDTDDDDDDLIELDDDDDLMQL